jgi:Secretion system C-terminal sorting domain
MKTIKENVFVGRENTSCYKCASGTYFTLHDLHGKCLITSAMSDSEQLIDLSELPAGEYVITVSGKNEIQTHKMVIS